MFIRGESMVKIRRQETNIKSGKTASKSIHTIVYWMNDNLKRIFELKMASLQALYARCVTF